MNKNLKALATRSIRWTSLNTICSIAIHFVQLSILGRLLSPKDFGLMAMVMVVIEFAMFFSKMGLSEAIIAKKDITIVQLSSLFWINIITGMVLYTTIIATTPLISYFFKEDQLRTMLPFVGIIFIISSPAIQFEALLRKHLMFDLLTKITLTNLTVNFIVSVVLAFHGFGVWALIYGYIGASISRTLLIVFIATKKKWLPGLTFNFNEIKELVSFGLHRVGAMAINQINARIDQLVIGSLLGPIALGYYTMAFRIVMQPVRQINPILTQVAFPVFSLMQGDDKQLKSAFLKMIRLLISINAPILIGIAAIAPIAVPLLLGEQWAASVPVVQCLAFYALLRSLGNASGGLILSKGKANWELYWNFVLFLFIPVTVYLAVSLLQSIAFVAVVLTASQILLVFLHYIFILRPLLSPFFIASFLSFAKPILISIVMGLPVYLIVILFDEKISNAQLFCISVSSGITIYLALSLVFQRSLFADFLELLPESLQKRIKIKQITS